jgi:hypothetical protein
MAAPRTAARDGRVRHWSSRLVRFVCSHHTPPCIRAFHLRPHTPPGIRAFHLRLKTSGRASYIYSRFPPKTQECPENQFAKCCASRLLAHCASRLLAQPFFDFQGLTNTPKIYAGVRFGRLVSQTAGEHSGKTLKLEPGKSKNLNREIRSQVAARPDYSRSRFSILRALQMRA